MPLKMLKKEALFLLSIYKNRLIKTVKATRRIKTRQAALLKS